MNRNLIIFIRSGGPSVPAAPAQTAKAQTLHLSVVGGEPSDAVKYTGYTAMDPSCRLTAITAARIQDKGIRF